MAEKIYFVVKIVCLIFILWHLWIFIFNRQMYGIWNKIYSLMRIVRIRLWKYRKKRMKQKARNARKKARRKKLVAKPDTPPNDLSAISYATDDVIGKTKIVYLEDPEVVRKTPTRSEPMKKEPIEEDSEINPEDVIREEKGLTEEEKEELMAPVDAQSDPDFDTAMTFEDISNVADVLMSEAPDEQKAIRAASTIHHKMQDTVILSFLTDKLSNQEKIHRLLNECLDDSGRPLARRKSTSKKMKTFDINEFV
ncbi:DUF4122 domain-containing protein [Bacteroides sp. AF34-31BH]|uniref:DUF4122 family protein n=1 Tax=Bacteroides sp. AF34-31BH TaxID=2292931 RepID=UPI000E748A3C|nr:DUF4122 family protein [Bacteroides sp. AF34-31BH]RJV02889.1 DUF4122 domain-containing protein [Bacteroides sp. AF34-31BH]